MIIIDLISNLSKSKYFKTKINQTVHSVFWLWVSQWFYFQLVDFFRQPGVLLFQLIRWPIELQFHNFSACLYRRALSNFGCTFGDSLFSFHSHHNCQVNYHLIDELSPDAKLLLVSGRNYLIFWIHLMMKLPRRAAFLRRMSRMFSLILCSFSKFYRIIRE